MARKGAERRGKEWNGAKKGGMERHGEGGGVGNNGAEATYVSREVRTYVPTYVHPFHCGRLYGMEKGTVTLGILLHFFLHIPYVFLHNTPQNLYKLRFKFMLLYTQVTKHIYH